MPPSRPKFTIWIVLAALLLLAALVFGILGIVCIVPAFVAEIVTMLFGATSLAMALWQFLVFVGPGVPQLPDGRITVHTPVRLCGRDVSIYSGFVNRDDIDTGFLSLCSAAPIVQEMNNGQPEGRAAFSLGPGDYTLYASDILCTYINRVKVRSNNTTRVEWS